ncbi:oxysterol binding protein [Moniliophthora roreri MCA 2997]|uniref:Oxysterol binding protein n=1 Tax=Moniliophthora roreri (strain MCA 2997) TaxID=1381753 RepID=V2X5F6_MONRO|nr:oxysterol binding protein [Moniliophthora roreri MCA 2997]
MSSKSKDKEDTQPTQDALDEGAPGPPISVPDSGDTGEGGKLKMIVQLVKKCLGVKDIASMRLSLPASLLEPIPNLEFSHYLDRPDVFASINDYDDPFERMLAVIRFAFTKDLKYIRGKVCKPYNSVLGEHFRAHWDVLPLLHPQDDPEEPPVPQIHVTKPTNAAGAPEFTMPGANLKADDASIRSGRSSKSYMSSLLTGNDKSPSTAATSPQQGGVDDLAQRVSVLNLSQGDGSGDKIRVAYLTEQVSHHPPISAYFGSCPDRHIEILGIDQISARVSGTVLKVAPGSYNKGIFVRIAGGKGSGELYRIMHPTASVNGLLRGSFYVTVSESMIITCTGSRGKHFRAVLEYKEESWLGRPHFLVEGVIHTVSEGDTQHEEWTKVKHVPPSRVVAVLDGTWRGEVRWKRVGTGSYPSHAAGNSVANSPNPSHTVLPSASNHQGASSKVDLPSSSSGDWNTLIDLSTLWAIPKQVRPLEKQGEKESRKLWESVTSRLLKKEFGDATKEKVAIEQKQRDEAAERKRKGVEFVPAFFEKDIDSGMPTLTEEGKKAIEGELKEENQITHGEVALH